MFFSTAEMQRHHRAQAGAGEHSWKVPRTSSLRCCEREPDFQQSSSERGILIGAVQVEFIHESHMCGLGCINP